MAEHVKTVLVEMPPRLQPPGARPQTRIGALDMTKGVLVVAMVIYHSFNYSTDYTLGFKYLPFLPPSFILITGFLISRLYFTPEYARDSRVHGRLFFRGFRLLLLFTLLNVATQVAGRQKFATDPQGIAYLADYWFEIYGIGGARFAAFSVLLPIAYLLLLAPLLILMHRWHPLCVPLVAVSLAIFCATSSYGDDYSVNLALLSAGLIGVIIGRVPDSALSLLRRCWYVSVAVYVGYIALSHLAWQNPFDQLLNAFLALVAIFSVCAAIGANTLFGRELLTMGRYSLLAYILQIAVLQVLARFFGRFEPFTVPFFLQMLGVLLVMIVMVEGLQWTRKRALWVDVSYRFVFA
jgi:peptidoglycan/LPS O-acetylase OafA/YrhL